MCSEVAKSVLKMGIALCFTILAVSDINCFIFRK